MFHKLRDSRFKSRTGIGLGIELKTLPVSEPELELGSRTGQYQNRNRNRKGGNRESLLQIEQTYTIQSFGFHLGFCFCIGN